MAGSNRNKAVLMLALVLGIASFALMFAFLQSRDTSDKRIDAATAGPDAKAVVVAVVPIKVGEKITAEMLDVKSIPGAGLLPGYATDIKAIVGQVASVPITPGEQILESKLTGTAQQNTLAYKVPEGKRALSLTVPHESWITAGLPQPGDIVDILGITVLSRIDPLTGQERPDVVSGYIAQGVEVLAVAQTIIRGLRAGEVASAGPLDAGTVATATATARASATATGTPGANTGTESKDQNSGRTFETAVSITLALDPDVAAKVALLDAMKDEVGQFRILVRQKGDTGKVTGTSTWTIDEIFPKTR
jgi:Flp pilus assembly protein CpaB